MKKQIKKIQAQQYVEDAWLYIKESKAYIGGAALFFLVCIFIGIIFADALTFFTTLIEEMRKSVSGLSGESLSLAIFLSNMRSALFSLFFGIFLGLFSILNIAINGTLIGYVIHALWREGGAVHLWKLLPHGIFELPALFISWGLGIKLGMFIFAENPGQELKHRLLLSLKAFLFIVVPLLFVAAIIEGLLITFLA